MRGLRLLLHVGFWELATVVLILGISSPTPALLHKSRLDVATSAATFEATATASLSPLPSSVPKRQNEGAHIIYVGEQLPSRTPLPPIPLPPPQSTTTLGCAEGQWHLVRPGETLAHIAGRYGVSSLNIIVRNRLSSSSIYIGQTLNIPAANCSPPPPATPVPHQSCEPFVFLNILMRSGESTDEYAARVGVSADLLRQHNDMPDEVPGSLIYLGMAYKVPNEDCPEPLPAATSRQATPEVTQTPPVHSPTVDHVVRPGESVASIARMYGVSVMTIIHSNAIANPNVLRVGQTLRIPTTRSTVPPPSSTATPSTSVAAPTRLLPTSPPCAPKLMIYKVRSGDTLYGIAARFGLPVSRIMLDNRLSSTQISIGQDLKITHCTYPESTPTP